MTLTPQQIVQIVNAIDHHWGLPQLMQFAAVLEINLNNLAPDGSLAQRAHKFVEHVNNRRPPGDRELLEELAKQPIAALQHVANDLLRPTFFSSTGLARDAILLGRMAFVDRADLRSVLQDFINPSPFTTRVLIVRGEQPGGKSYSWYFLQHLAFDTGATAMRLRLKDTSYTPRQIFENVGRMLRLDMRGLPPMTDEPQLSRTDPLVSWFKGEVVAMQRPYWLVIDDLNEPSATKPMREAVYAIAYAVEEAKPQNLWVALLGYNDSITDPDLQYIAQEAARFPNVAHVADHFECIAKASPQALTASRALGIANLVLAKSAPLDKENMMKANSLIQQIGEKLRLGQQP